MYNQEQILNAITRYVDSEIMPSLPTHAKWLVGTYIVSMSLDSSKLQELMNHPLISPLHIEHNGMYDLDQVLENLHENADKYGKMTVRIPLVGTMSFSSEDVAKLHEYLKMEK